MQQGVPMGIALDNGLGRHLEHLFWRTGNPSRSAGATAIVGVLKRT